MERPVRPRSYVSNNDLATKISVLIKITRVYNVNAIMNVITDVAIFAIPVRPVLLLQMDIPPKDQPPSRLFSWILVRGPLQPL